MEEKQLSVVEKDLELGKIFAESGLFPDIKSAAQGYVKILAGRELGLSPIQSLNTFYFVNGKLGMMSQAVAGLIKKSQKYDYAIETHTEQECSIAFYRISESSEKEKLGVSHFDIKMAAKCGIVNKDSWKNYPKNLLFSRALMNGVRWFCPDILVATVYSTEELQDLSREEPTVVLDFDEEGNQKSEVKNG